jgi:hypothetical protein
VPFTHEVTTTDGSLLTHEYVSPGSVPVSLQDTDKELPGEVTVVADGCAGPVVSSV